MEFDSEKTTYKLSSIDIVRYFMPWPFHRDLPKCPNGENPRISFGDLVLSVLPWPFHKDLPKPCSENKAASNK